MNLGKRSLQHRACACALAVALAALVPAALVLAISALPADRAYGITVAELSERYEDAIVDLRAAEENQKGNAEAISALEAQIARNEQQLQDSRERLGRTLASYYKSMGGPGGLVELILGSSSFYDAAMRFETYEKVQAGFRDRISELQGEQDNLASESARLAEQRDALTAEVDAARQAADAAREALLKARHDDGDKYHQTQGDAENCGATAFTVAVNMLLGEERFPDNVEVWEGAGFEKNSISDLAGRARTWLAANGLLGQIEVEELAGDIHQAIQLKEQLDQGYVVIISSGPGSVWQHADGTTAPADAYPGGHWILFYRYDDGVFYANDSAVGHEAGAGCPYTEEQLQQWLDGRENHFATVVKTV